MENKPQLLIEIENDFRKDPENFNFRKWVPKMKELRDFFDDKYPRVKNISEKLYLYLHGLDEPPVGKVWKNFEYQDKHNVVQFAEPVDDTQQEEFDPESLENLMESMGLTPGNFDFNVPKPEIVLTFREKFFLDNIQPKDEIYFARFQHQSGQLLTVLYNENSGIVYIFLSPKSLMPVAFKNLFEKEYKCEVVLDTLPLEIINKILDPTISSSPAISHMAYILQKKHNLYV